MKRLHILGVGLGFALGCVANAATLVTAPVTYNFGPTQTLFDDPISVAQFDPTVVGYALHSVHILLTGTAQAGPGGVVDCVEGGQGGTCDGTLTSSITITLTGPGNLFLAQVLPLTSYTYSLPQGTLVNPPTQTDTQNSGMLIFNDPPDTAIVSLFSGNGTVALNLHGLGDVVDNNGNGFTVTGMPLHGSGTVQVAYDYVTPGGVPEPATMVLFGSALLGLGFIRRRKA